jgi:ketosteroid isomerase-like protein
MDHATFKEWLDAYGRAWVNCDPQAAAQLFAEDGTYQVTPFVKPLCGRQSIFEYWAHIAQTQEDIQFAFEILSVTPDFGIARWRADFVINPPGLKTQLDGIFLIALDSAGRCKSLKEWWHKQQD